jgi:DNA-binding GntR family transcriptional regulator
MSDMAVDRPARNVPGTRAAVVARELRKLILSGEIPPGNHLRQAEIARRFGVSTTPVREAFVALAREGLVRRDAHRGVVVFSPSLTELAELYEMRSALESLATELSATRLSARELDTIARVIERMRDAEPRRCAALNAELHTRIYAACGRPRLVELIDELRNAASNYHDISLSVEGYDGPYRKQVQREHEEILAVLRRGDPKGAGHAVRAHLERSAVHMSELVKTVAIADAAEQGQAGAPSSTSATKSRMRG